ncbi:diphthamide biosynthesis protein 2 [Tieghemostelium lacteum]|uniref:2-(3-amino-3-carboxypropyl)histidine synthase subunit 2 n=1 Tax=Tieghemostelium lacteum TaxID=361077 RepID=A0A151Z3A1_TIELA|nr:diphthamide biosynthesis protein 2 [Tieghemostelium lacteum]|eukprot:KYQ88419.1 diphthamide biosynthesis protein 2 [Tieghemostelium lacteum]
MSNVTPAFFTESFDKSLNNTHSSNKAVKSKSEEVLDKYSFNDYFEVEKSIEIINEYNFKNVALQLPEHLLWASQELSRILTTQANHQTKVYILGDTAYGSCCIDEVTALHLKTDFIIHYGHSCLSPSSRIPVQFVFGKKSFDIPAFYSTFQQTFTNTTEKFIIFYELQFQHYYNDLCQTFKNSNNVVITSINNFNNIFSTKSFLNNSSNQLYNSNSSSSECCSKNSSNETTCCSNENLSESSCCNNSDNNNNVIAAIDESNLNSNGNIFGRTVSKEVFENLGEYNFLWIGGECITLTNLLMNYSKNCFYRYYINGDKILKETLPRNYSLMKRYYISEKCKDSSVIGIVVATLTVAKYSETIDQLKKLIISAGKKPYVFVVGRLNVPKLGNFSEIDIFVIVACPENSLIDSKEYYKPIATPFELNLALKNKNWTGEYISDFGQLFPTLTNLNSDDDDQQPIPEDQVDDDEGNTHHFSLLSGKIVMKNNRKVRQQQLQTSNTTTNETKDLITTANDQFKQLQIVEDHLSDRTYKGLDMRIGETPVVKAVQGLSGIPMHYQDEPNNTTSTSNTITYTK